MQVRSRGPRVSDERGAAVVEFAIVFPLLVMFLLGIVQFSLMYNLSLIHI